MMLRHIDVQYDTLLFVTYVFMILEFQRMGELDGIVEQQHQCFDHQLLIGGEAECFSLRRQM